MRVLDHVMIEGLGEAQVTNLTLDEHGRIEVRPCRIENAENSPRKPGQPYPRLVFETAIRIAPERVSVVLVSARA